MKVKTTKGQKQNYCIFPQIISDQKLSGKFSECVRKYLEDDGLSYLKFTKTVSDEFPDEPAIKNCRDTLNSATKIETLVLVISI